MSQVVVGDRARHYFNVLVNPKVKYYTWITILSTYKVPNFLSKYLHLCFLCSKETIVYSVLHLSSKELYHCQNL